MIAQEGLVHSVLVHHDVHHGERQGGIGGGLDWNPQVGAGGQLGHNGIDDHQLGASILSIGHEMPVVELGIGDVGAPHEQRLRILEIGGIIEHPVAQVAHHAVDAPGVGLVAGDLDHTRVDLVEEDVVHGRDNTADGAQVARSARIGDGLLAILCLNTLPLIGDFLDGLFPGNALPLAGAALAYTAHGILDAVGPVHVVDMAQASQADTVDAAVGERIELPLRRFDDLAVDDVQVQLAGAGAVAAAHAAEYLLTVALGLSCLIGRSLGEPARREGTRASGGHSGGSNTR